MKLTKIIIDHARYEGDGSSRCVVWDEEVTGLGLRVFPSGKKSWVLSYRAGGRKRLVTLGPWGVLTVEAARSKARRELVKVEDGKDPLEERRAAASAGLTVRELCEEFLERHAKPKKRTWRGDELRLGRAILPEWGSRPIASMKRADVAALHQRMGKGTPCEANRTLRLVSKMWNCAREWGYLPEGAPNPAKGIEQFREEKRDRWLRPEELSRLVAAIVEEANPWIRGVFVLYLLTGARKSELLAARWEDVDLARRELRLPRTKAGRIHYIPLSAEACAVLESLPREEGNPHVFPGHKVGEHLVAIEKSWRATRKRAGLEDVRLHDLRRTVGSHLAMGGASLPVIGKVLNHSNASTTQIYARLAEDVGRKPLEALGAKVAALAGEHAERLGLVAPRVEEERDAAAGA